eukprot:150026-Hanusia_phi.AAC.1
MQEVGKTGNGGEHRTWKKITYTPEFTMAALLRVVAEQSSNYALRMECRNADRIGNVDIDECDP